MFVCLHGAIYTHIYICCKTCFYWWCFPVSVLEYEVNHHSGTQSPIENGNCLVCQFNAGLALKNVIHFFIHSIVLSLHVVLLKADRCFLCS